MSISAADISGETSGGLLIDEDKDKDAENGSTVINEDDKDKGTEDPGTEDTSAAEAIISGPGMKMPLYSLSVKLVK